MTTRKQRREMTQNELAREVQKMWIANDHSTSKVAQKLGKPQLWVTQMLLRARGQK